MPTPSRYFENNRAYHIYNRGNRREQIFLRPEDYVRFVTKLYEYAKRDDVQILSYCLMPNHFHLLLYQLQDNGIEKLMRSISTSSAKYYNWQYGQVGHLCQERFRSRLILDEADLLNISAYILLNPSAMGDFRKYRWSSYEQNHQKSQECHGLLLRLCNVSKEQYEVFLTDYAMEKLKSQTTSGVAISGVDLLSIDPRGRLTMFGFCS